VSDIVVSYVERPDITLEYGLRYSSSASVGVGGAPTSPDNGRLQVAGALDLANPLGWGWHLRPYALLTTDRHTFGAALESATLLGLRVRTQLLVFDDDDNRATVSSLASRIRGFSLQQTRALLEDTSAERRHDRLRLQWGYADKRIQYFDGTGVETSLAGKRSYLSLSLAGDERDSLADPHRGLFWTASSELARTAFGSDVNYLRFYGQLFVYLPLPGRMVWAQGYRAGVAPGRNPLLLLDNRFQAGGPTTVRGYNQNDLGPQTTEGIGLGGQGVVILNQELRFPIWNLVSGGVFWDAGNVWETANEIRLGDLRQSLGVGLRVMFPFGPVRLEYAWKVGPNRSGRAGRFVFGLGHAF
jgi:outer membrane protein assembly factor BamA